MGQDQSQSEVHTCEEGEMNGYVLHKPADIADIPRCILDCPSPGPGEVLIRVCAATVNPVDCYRKESLHGDEYPVVPGTDGCGLVAAIGSGVSAEQFPIDSAVVFTLDISRPYGAFAEYCLASVQCVWPIPPTLSWATASSSVVAAGHAQLLCDRLGIGAKAQLNVAETLLILGGGPSWGLDFFLIQLAVARKVTVFVACEAVFSGIAQSAGAAHVWDIENEDIPELVMENTGGRLADTVVNLWDSTGAGLRSVLRWGGQVAVFAEVPDTSALSFVGATLVLYVPNSYVVDRPALLSKAVLEVCELYASKQLNTIPTEVVEFAHLKPVMSAILDRATTSKVAVSVFDSRSYLAGKYGTSSVASPAVNAAPSTGSPASIAMTTRGVLDQMSPANTGSIDYGRTHDVPSPIVIR